jgi:hypothetical protein
VRAYNRANSQKPAIDGWGEWSAPSKSVRGATPPGEVPNVTARATGVPGQSQLTFGQAPANGAESVEYRYSVNGGAGQPIAPGGATLSNLRNAATNDIRVWAVSYANGKPSEPGPINGTGVKPFGPCTVSVQMTGENYDSVGFQYRLAPDGRDCKVKLDITGGNGTTAVLVPNEISNVDTGSYDVGADPGGTTVRMTYTLTTQNEPGDLGGARTSSASAAGKTWVAQAVWTTTSQTCSTTGFPNCKVADVTLDGWKPNTRVWCFTKGEGAQDANPSVVTDGRGHGYIGHAYEFQGGFGAPPSSRGASDCGYSSSR